MRRQAFERVGGYREGTYRWEDVDLFLRLTRAGQVLVLPEALYRYRYHPDSLTASAGDDRDDGAGLMWSSIAAFRRGEEWTELLETPATADEQRAPAAAWATRHSQGLSLWSGSATTSQAPAPTRLLRLRRWWQEASPATLRAALSTGMRIRDLAAGVILPRNEAIRWRPR